MKTIIQKTISLMIRASMMLTVIPFTVLVKAQEESEENIGCGNYGQDALLCVRGSLVQAAHNVA